VLAFRDRVRGPKRVFAQTARAAVRHVGLDIGLLCSTGKKGGGSWPGEKDANDANSSAVAGTRKFKRASVKTGPGAQAKRLSRSGMMKSQESLKRSRGSGLPIFAWKKRLWVCVRRVGPTRAKSIYQGG